MDELAARAVVVPASAVGKGLTTSIPRSEIKEVLDQDETPIELVLEVAHFTDGKATDTRSVKVSWERSELEELLGAADGENVVLTFDGEALGQAFATDVEAHGIREAVLALAVAATAATGVAGSASAEPGKYLGTGTTPTEIPYLSQGQGVTPADLGIAADEAAAPTQAAPEIPVSQPGSGSDPGRPGDCRGRGRRANAGGPGDPVSQPGSGSDPGRPGDWHGHRPGRPCASAHGSGRYDGRHGVGPGHLLGPEPCRDRDDRRRARAHDHRRVLRRRRSAQDAPRRCLSDSQSGAPRSEVALRSDLAQLTNSLPEPLRTLTSAA